VLQQVDWSVYLFCCHDGRRPSLRHVDPPGYQLSPIRTNTDELVVIAVVEAVEVVVVVEVVVEAVEVDVVVEVVAEASGLDVRVLVGLALG